MNKSQLAAARAAMATMGVSKNDAAPVASDWLGDAIFAALGKFVTSTIGNIENTQTIYTGAILNLDIIRKDGAFTVTGAKELLFQNYGVMGAVNKTFYSPYSYKDLRPPIDPILEWVKKKAANSKNEKKTFGDKGKLKEFKTGDTDAEQLSHAYAVRELIYKNGIKPKDLITTPLRQLDADIKAAVNNRALLNVAIVGVENFEIKVKL